jgi:acyl-coenzyme A thioesterase PaaI-like protein
VGLELHGRARIARKTTRTAEVAVSLAQGESTVLEGTFTFVLLDKTGAEKLLGRALPPEWARFAR